MNEKYKNRSCKNSLRLCGLYSMCVGKMDMSCHVYLFVNIREGTLTHGVRPCPTDANVNVCVLQGISKFRFAQYAKLAFVESIPG